MILPHNLHKFIVSSEKNGERLDRFLAEMMENTSRSRVKSLIQAGHLTCNDSVCRDPSMKLHEGSHLSLLIPQPLPAHPVAENIALDILYEDEDIIVINKPSNFVVHPAPGNETGTLVNALLYHCKDSLQGIGGEKRPGIVHRLDKDTSGVMVAAKTELAHKELSDAFSVHDIERRYQALVWGRLPSYGTWEGAIGRDKRDRKRMAVVTHNGKEAVTHFKTEQIIASGCISHVICQLETGRTHQIRVHFSHHGYPLIGDPLYLKRIPAAAKKMDKILRDTALDFPRQALHATTLGFNHPRTKKFISFEAPLPKDFKEILEKLII